MSIGTVIIIGAVIGYIASKIRGSGFGLLWDIYLGITGAIFASLTMIYAYFMNILSKPFVLGMNSYSIIVGIAGALALIYIAWLYNNTGSIRQIWQMKQKRQSLSILSASLRYKQTGA